MIEIISKTEVWVPVVGYIGLYEVSSFGRVRSLGKGLTHKTPKIIKQEKTDKGYLRVDLSKNGKVKKYKVHRLVAQAFLPNWFDEPQINHRDEDKHNNHVDNLEWCDAKYNQNYGTAIKRRSEKSTNGKCSKKVLQYDLEGNFIAEYPSSHEVQRQLGFLRGNISLCCRGKYKQSYGFIWKYKD